MVWHVPAVFALGMRSHWWHLVQFTCFFAAGLLFWWPVIQPWQKARWSRWSIPMYLFLATLPCDVLSAYLTFCDYVVYAPYLSASPALNASALQDQQIAGALMWVCITFVYLLPAVVITIQLLSPEISTLKGTPASALRASAGKPAARCLGGPKGPPLRSEADPDPELHHPRLICEVGVERWLPEILGARVGHIGTEVLVIE